MEPQCQYPWTLENKLSLSPRTLTQEVGLIMTRPQKITLHCSALAPSEFLFFSSYSWKFVLLCLSYCLVWMFSPISTVQGFFFAALEFDLRRFAFSRGVWAPFLISGWCLSLYFYMRYTSGTKRLAKRSIDGCHVTSLKFKLENYWSSSDFIFMMCKRGWN